jgi:hypothetical protein
MEGVLTPNHNPNPNPNPNRNPNSNPNQINEKIQKETTLEIDQITKCQFGRWKLVKTLKVKPKMAEIDVQCQSFLLFLSAQSTQIDVQCQSLSIVFVRAVNTN